VVRESWDVVGAAGGILLSKARGYRYLGHKYIIELKVGKKLAFFEQKAKKS